MNMNTVKQWIAEGNLDSLENAWMDAIAAPTDRARLAKLADVLAALVAAGKSEEAETLAGMLLEEWGESRPPQEALDAARALLPTLPGSTEIRQAGEKLYRKVHGSAEHFDDYLAAAGLTDNQSPRRAVRTLETCLAVKRGTYLANRFDHRVVRLESYDPVLKHFELTTAGGKGESLEPKLLADEFEIVDEGDFRVLAQFRGEELGELLQGDPAAALAGICMSNGGQIDTNQLKALLAPRHIAPDQYSKWWSRARSAVRKSEQLVLEGRNPVTISYHPHGRTLEEELAGRVSDARVPLDLLNILRDYARELRHRGQQVEQAFVDPILQTLAEQSVAFKRRRPTDALTASLAIDTAALLGLGSPEALHAPAAEALGETAHPSRAILALEDNSLWPAALEALAAREDAGEHFEKLLRAAPADWLDPIAARLRELGRTEAIEQAAAEALTNASDNLQICLWLWQGPAEPVAAAPSRLELLGKLLGAMEAHARDWEMDHDDRKAAFQQVRAALVASDCRAFRATMEEMDDAVAATIHRRIARCDALSAASREDLMGVLREHFYSLFVKERVAPWADETILWTTEQALARREAEMKELTEIKLPANSRAIGEAAAKGDLSENSEWESAVAEQRRLNGQLIQIQNELAMARTLHPDDVPRDSVGIGSRVVLHDALAREVAVTFLGPWEADVDRRIYNYRTPLAQALMGKTVGESAELKVAGEEGLYTIVRLENALADSKAPATGD